MSKNEKQASKSQKVLYIGIDGCRPDCLNIARTPFLDSLMVKGLKIHDALTCEHSNSGTCWSSLLTGVWENKHGVYDNSCIGSNFEEYKTIFQLIKEHKPPLKSAAIVNWTTRHHPIMEGVDIYRLEDGDENVCRQSKKALENENLDLLYLLYNDVDTAGHACGFSRESEGYIDAIEKTDKLIKELFLSLNKRMESAPTEDWLVVITTDHGGIGKVHGGVTQEERTIFFLFWSLNTLSLKSSHSTFFAVDIVPTICQFLNVDLQRNNQFDGNAILTIEQCTKKSPKHSY